MVLREALCTYWSKKKSEYVIGQEDTFYLIPDVIKKSAGDRGASTLGSVVI